MAYTDAQRIIETLDKVLPGGLDGYHWYITVPALGEAKYLTLAREAGLTASPDVDDNSTDLRITVTAVRI
jgi:hypothetical protein